MVINRKRWKKGMKKEVKKDEKSNDVIYDKKYSFYQKYFNQITHAIPLHSFQSLKFT